MGCCCGLWRLTSWIHTPAEWPWGSSFLSLCLGFLTCQPCGVVVRMKQEAAQSGPGTCLAIRGWCPLPGNASSEGVAATRCCLGFSALDDGGGQVVSTAAANPPPPPRPKGSVPFQTRLTMTPRPTLWKGRLSAVLCPGNCQRYIHLGP